MGYRIKDVADRSGFSAPTLRYYEEIGLIPSPGRTPSGYRSYDDTTIERLAFIGRAKQLGCSLEEIGELSQAWDGGECAPVQDRLQRLVNDKIAAAQQQIAALTTLVGELHRASRQLHSHRPTGPCDDRCGCASDATVTFGRRPGTVNA